MNGNVIVQFVGFITTLDSEKFVARWNYYMQQLKTSNAKSTLQQQCGVKNRFKYISQHICPQENFKFAFMNKRDSAHFPEHNVRVVHAGGYVPVQIESNLRDKERNMNVMVFVKNPLAHIDFYRKLSLYSKLNIYQAYYENCSYAYIMEFFVKEMDVTNFVSQLNPGNTNPHISDEAALYEEYQVLHA